MPPTRLRSVPRPGAPGGNGVPAGSRGPSRAGRPGAANGRSGGTGRRPADPAIDRAAGGTGRAATAAGQPELQRQPTGRADPRAARRAFTLILLTLAAPGSAQLVQGRAVVGRIAIRIWAGFLGLVALLVLAWFVHREFVLRLFTHQWMLRPLAVALIAAGIGWPLLMFDAWRLGRPGTLTVRNRRIAALLTLTLVALLCLLPIAAGRRVWAGADLLGGVFGSGRKSAAVDGRYNVLLLGGDAGPDRIGTRPDSMTLASIDEKNGKTVLISLPRNLQNVPFLPGTPAAKANPNGWSCGDTCLLNAIYTYASEHPALFPGGKDPGATAMKQVIQSITGLKVNYYVMIDLKGFRSLIDAVGGIDIYVDTRVPIGGETSPIWGYIEPGKRHLNGFKALWYGRSRTGSSDYARMARQRCVMTAMVNQLDPGTLLAHFQDIAKAGAQVVSTDIPAGELPAFVTLGTKAKSQKIQSIQFVPPLIVPHHPDFALIKQKVAEAIASNNKAAVDSPTSPAVSAPASSSAPAATTAGPAASPGSSGSTNSTASSASSAGAGKPVSGAASSPAPAASQAAASAGPVDVRQVCQPA